MNHLDVYADGQDGWRADAVVLLTFDGGSEQPETPGAPEHFPWMTGTPCYPDVKTGYGETAVVYGPDDAVIPRLVTVGVGKPEELTLDRFRGAVSEGMRKAARMRCKTVGLLADNLLGLGLNTPGPTCIQEAVAAGAMALYRYTRLKTDTESLDPLPENVALLSGKGDAEMLRRAGQLGIAEAAGVALARDLVNGPANLVTPSFLARTAQELGREYDFSVSVMDTEEIEKLGMGCFAAVFQGSAEPACCIVMEWALPGCEEEPPLALVGKGVTFDTGGISIKPSANMDKMKSDMAGAAAVLGVFKTLGELRRKGDLFLDHLRTVGRVVAVIPCTDNMCDGMSIRPGDVVASHAGKTVEIINTDAEGRLLLCDALSYVSAYQPSMVVDIATLTGACVVALGRRGGAVYGTNDELTQHLKSIGEAKGEPLWPMPLWEFYAEELKSSVADMRNIASSREGGSIHAALFLKAFVPEGVHWAHLDIAGPGWSDKRCRDLVTADVEGGTGFGVRILLELAGSRHRLEL